LLTKFIIKYIYFWNFLRIYWIYFLFW